MSTTAFQQIAAASNWHLRVNENFDSVSPSGLYGRNPATTTGLTWGYLGGNFSGVSVANGTVALTASNTNYVVAHRTTGVVTAATTTTNWLNTGVYLPLYQIVAGASTITSYDDKRQAFGDSSAFVGGTLATSLNEAPAVTIASAATINIGAAASNTVNVTGTTTITAFDTIAASAIRRLVFSGVLTLTHNGTSLILPTASSITTAAGDIAEFVSLGSGNWRCINYMRASGSALLGSPFSGGTLTSALNEAPTVTIASSATPAIGAAAGNSISLTGTTTVTGFDTIAAGAFRRVVFAGALTLTHNATSLILPTGANIATAAGDVADFLSLGSGNWRCINYMRASGAALSAISLSAVNVWTKNQSVTPVTNSSATGTVTPDASTSNSFQYTLTGNVTIANPTNLTSGMVLNFCLDEDATGGRTIAFGSSYKWPGGTVPTWVTTASAKNFFSAYYDGTILRCSGAGGFA
jgi:hypothetical protein